MKNSYILLGTFAVLCGTAMPMASSRLLAAPAGTEAGNSADRLPVDLARGSLGARLQVLEPKSGATAAASGEANRSAQALISDDAALSYPLSQGNTSMILTLRKADVLSRLNFINYGAEGKITISASSTKLPFESKDWHPVANGLAFGGSKVVGCDLGSLEARYLKIDFQTQNAGRISGLGVFGLLTINSLDPHPVSPYATVANPGVNSTSGSKGGDVYFDYANLNTGAKVVGVSRGGSVGRAQAMLDGNVETNYTFDPTDPTPTVVVDLSARRALNRLSCVFQAPAGRMDFYVVDNPYTRDYQHSATLSYVSPPSTEPATAGSASDFHRSSLAEHKAVASINTTGEPGISRASADIGGASGRFLVAEFHPIANAPQKHVDGKDFNDAPDFKDFKDVADAQEGQPLRLISLGAFGDNPSTDTITRIPNVPNIPNFPPPGGVGVAQPPVLPGSGGVVLVTP